MRLSKNKLDRLIILLVCISIYSCKKQDGAIEIPIDLEQESKALSEIIDSYSFIKLENNDLSSIGTIENIVQTDEGYIYVLDFTESRAVFIFSESGKFIKKLKLADEGLDFSAPQRFQISQKNNQLLIFDIEMKAFSVYDLEGNFQYLIDIPNSPRSFILLDNGQYLLEYDEFPSQKHRIHITDTEFNVIKKLLPKESSLSILLGMSLSTNKNHISYIPSFSNTIYRMEDFRMIKSYILDFSSGWITPNEIIHLTSLQYPQWAEEFESKYPIIRADHYGSQTYIAIPFEWRNRSHTVFINKLTNTAFGPWFMDDIGIGGIDLVRGVSDNHFFSVIKPETLIDGLKNDQVHNKNLQKIAKNLDYTDNPVIVKFRLK